MEHIIAGAFMAFIFSSILNHRNGKPIIAEATLSAGLSVALGAGILAYGLDEKWALFAGGMIGCVGFNDTIRIVKKGVRKWLND